MRHENSIHFDRRRFLGTGLASSAAALTAPAWLPRVSWDGTAGTGRDTLVVVFLRGGTDGLTMCVPYGDANLYTLRPNIAIGPPGTTSGALDLDGYFGFAPAMAPLMPAFQSGHLAIVDATGLSDPSRSHFDMQRWLESGITGAMAGGIATGWVGRYLQTIAPAGSGLMRGLAIENAPTRTLAGGPACVAVPDPSNFTMPGQANTAALRRAALTTMHATEPFPLGPAALDSFATMDLLATIDFDNYVPANGAVYPNTPFGTKLKSAAALIKANIGVEAIQADLGGWDHHNQLGPIQGTMATLMDTLSRALAAFELDLSDGAQTLDRVTLVCMSEFGRRANENGSGGADHGHGNCMLVMGGNVLGGQVVTNWPTLAPASLDHGDLAITIDIRDILAEVLADRMACTDLATVFPGYVPVFRNVIA